jgi:monovalent cation:H+ antiporter-2, CPA2 family
MKAASTLGSSTGLPDAVLDRPYEWNLQIDEINIPLGSGHAGRRIADLAIRKTYDCSIMAIDRQGFLITNPTAEERLYAGDKLLLVGAPEQLSQAEQALRTPLTRATEDFEQIGMEPVDAPSHSPAIGKTLHELNVPGRFNIQVCAIERDGNRNLSPASTNEIRAGDKLLVLGPHESIQSFRNFLSANQPDTEISL